MIIRRRHRRPGLRATRQPIHRLIPNILTMLALCAGLTALRFGLEGRFEAAVLAVVAAAILDVLDGRIARLIGATSRFGAELDSLSDFVCFGVVPGVLLYVWSVQQAGGMGWAAVLLFAVCSALRLARFNTALDDQARPAWTHSFFVGVPAPAAAGVALLPLIASFEFPPSLQHHPAWLALWITAVGLMMVSRLPTYALKRVRVPMRMVGPMLLAIAAFTAALISEPWLTLLASGTLYLVLIPLAFRSARRMARNEAARPPASPPVAPPPPDVPPVSLG